MFALTGLFVSEKTWWWGKKKEEEGEEKEKGIK